MKDNNQQTRIFDSEQVKQQNIKYILKMVDDALNERGYNSVTQIVGYLVTNDPAYISSYKNARTLIQTVDRDEILKEIVRSYLANNE
ncbi:MAG: IreB family regulatory phosphoprotein [Erysipelotrichaceae bacterium]|nr:IreB family regulatory phosphoprotein [Erysipelotrichaceae bacterium]MDY3829640.1 IreB family regulatory phosphoprotein [Erysipelotrichaceae bacterium]MDY5727635.1 IreB family regulatory phosphoprotein [Erysipelotrichaceae bacterium]